ncbi:MAG: DUF1775 domain-containing protein [Ketobacter sp.]|nr:DUF1775 domain-containing protein [Ketobacter sp.]
MFIKCVMFCAGVLMGANVFAHVSIVSGPFFVGSRSIVTLSVPHGCDGYDTIRVEVDIPESFTSIRPLDSVFGSATFETRDDGSISKILWTKPLGAGKDSDTHYYTMSFRAVLPDTPFAKAYLPTVQHCVDESGEPLSVSWDEVSDAHGDHGGSTKPAPSLTLMPVRHPGWNQYVTTTGQHLHDMSLFSDAEIVWWNDAAYSSNPVTLQMIEAEVNVGVLSEIHDNATFWVKY